MGALHAACLKSVADGPEAAATRTLAAQGAGYKNEVCGGATII